MVYLSGSEYVEVYLYCLFISVLPMDIQELDFPPILS